MTGRKVSEDATQRLVVAWMRRQHPSEADWLHHSPNGGWRAPATGARLKAAGTRRGFPDLIYPRARGGFAGLAIELKAHGGRATIEQIEWLHLLSAEGWHATICIGFDAARDTISDYMRLPHGRNP
jgi:hypothetical protein